MDSGLCSSRVMTPSCQILSPSREESGDEELSVLPRHTKVIVTGNNRTKSVLVGLQGVVKKAVGLGGWHWLVLKNGMEVKLQRNALSVLEAPTGNEDDVEENEFVNSFCSSSEKDNGYSSIEFQKLAKPKVRRLQPFAKSSGGSYGGQIQSYSYKAQTVSSNPNPSKEQLIHEVQRHFLSQKSLDEMQVIVGFIHTAKRLKTLSC